MPFKDIPVDRSRSLSNASPPRHFWQGCTTRTLKLQEERPLRECSARQSCISLRKCLGRRCPGHIDASVLSCSLFSCHSHASVNAGAWLPFLPVIPFSSLSFPFFFCHSHESGNPFFMPSRPGPFHPKSRQSRPPRFSPFRGFERDHAAPFTSAAEPPTVALAVSSENRYNPSGVCPPKEALKT